MTETEESARTRRRARSGGVSRHQWCSRVGVWLFLLATPLQAQSVRACPPPSFSRADLLTLRTQEFSVANASVRESLALALLDCLGDPDPALRDGVAFEALATWMREGRLPPSTAVAVLERLLPRLAPAHPDPRGFERPFSALMLAEVARMDRMEPFLTEEQRASLVDAAVEYLVSVTDYRGFDEREGWRHGVAHGADLMLQLSLNPGIGKAELSRILSALALQVAPRGEHFYIYGEGMRLARAVYYVGSREMHSEAEWTEWLERLTDSSPLPDWSVAFQSQAGLAKVHNTGAFLQALYLLVRENDPAFADRILPPLREAIGRVP